jgi:hypothetical protein
VPALERRWAAAGPILLLATKTRKEPTPHGQQEGSRETTGSNPAAKSSVTVGGLVAAAAITLGAAAGELWVVYRAATTLDLGGLEDWLPLLAVVAGLALLVLYGCRTLLETLRAGTTKPPPPPPSDFAAFARAIADALSKRQVDEETVSGALEEATKYPEVGPYLRTSPGDEYLPPRRAAIF